MGHQRESHSIPPPPVSQVRATADGAGPVASELARQLDMRANGATHRGVVKRSNDDQFLVATLTGALWVSQSSYAEPRVRCGEPKGHLLVVADGIGEDGEAASRATVRSLQAEALRSLAWLLRDLFVTEELKEGLRQTERVVNELARTGAKVPAGGATVTSAYVIGDSLYLAHVGDGRAYLFRGGRLVQLTRVHAVRPPSSFGLRAVEARRHQVTNALGAGHAGVSVEVHQVRLEDEDVVLLCTDGLGAMIHEQRIAATVAQERDTAAICQRLVGIANVAGGTDNVTVVAARFGARSSGPGPG